jgi:LAO/AO transport system kinase
VGRAYRIGITGLTGAGKSTLVNELTKRYRSDGLTVGVVAEDPTSPFSGGAILGDRVRMQETGGDDGVFIRSIASRGSETGLSACASELADVLDAFGRDIIFLETIGIGQLEYKIRFSAQTTAVVLTPDAGDDVQSLKSGLMEVGDVFVVNKADRTHAARFADDLSSMLELRSEPGKWLAPVVRTVGIRGEGIDDLVGAIAAHRAYLAEDDRMEQHRIASLHNRLAMVAEEKLKEIFWRNAYIKQKVDVIMNEVVSGKKSPYQAASEITAPFKIADDQGETR